MAVIGIDLDGDQLVLHRGRDFKWVFANLDENNQPADFVDGDLYFELDTGGAIDEIQQITVDQASSGTYTLALDTHATAAIDYYDVTGAPQNVGGDITSALEALPNIGAGNVIVSEVSLIPVWRLDLQLGQNQNEIQKLNISGSDLVTFRLSFRSKITGPLSVSASAATIQAALQGLATIGSGNVTVTAVSGGFTIEFVGALALQNVPQIAVLGFPIGGKVWTTTTQQGTPGLTEQTINLYNTTLNNFFDNFQDLLGVDLNFVVNDQFHVVFTATSRKSYPQSGLLTFAVDVTGDLIEDAFNAVTDLLDLTDTVQVDFYWKHTFQVEFTGALGLMPQSLMVSNVTALVGGDTSETPSVTVQRTQPGKARYTQWPFTISGSIASIKVESEASDLIVPRTNWQLVFLATGEAAGGDPLARGLVKVQK